MFALGRWPNVDGLGLEAAGVRFTRNRGIAVDPLSQTSVPHIHAVGDVTNRVNLTPVAIREGHAFADTVFGGKPTVVDHANVPTAVFSEPEVGAMGLTEAEACARLAKVDIYKTMFRPMKMTLAGRDTRAFFKLVVDGETIRWSAATSSARRRRDDPACRHRGEDGSDQSRLRRGDGRSPHHRRGARDAAGKGLEPPARGCGVTRPRRTEIDLASGVRRRV